MRFVVPLANDDKRLDQRILVVTTLVTRATLHAPALTTEVPS